MVRISTVLGLFSLLTSGLALALTGVVQWNELCPGVSSSLCIRTFISFRLFIDYASLGRAKVVLDDGYLSGSVTKDGRFIIPDVPAGTYILSVVSHDHRFDQLRVDVVADSESKPEIRPYTPGTPLNPPSIVTLPYPIKLQARYRSMYFVPPQSFNLLGMFNNPMMLMMVFGGLMMFAMPYLTKNLDPEMLQEFQQNQAKVANLQSSIQSGDIRSGYSALLGEEQRPGAASTGSQTNTTSGTTKNRTKKRR
ncbi:hypothetical protein OF83DRAFT_211424 [Amylostereum chailletii]|nr:hypothetical protein OF83DRAFT_211424 [Amylostereum chailletii]